MSKPLSAGLLVLLASFALAACGGDDDSGSAAAAGGGEPKRVYIEQFAKGVRAFTRRAEAFETRSKELGWDVIGVDYGDGTPETQVRQLQNALSKRPDAIVTIPINPDAITPVVAQAKADGVPVVTIGSSVSDRSQILTHFSYEPERYGAQKAQYIVDQLKGKGKVGVVHGIRGHQFAEGQKVGLEKVFKANPGIQVIDGGYTDFSSEGGLKATENLLTRARDLDAIYYDSDDIAVGGIQAIKEAGIDPGDIITVGSDLTPAAAELVRSGDLTYTIAGCTYNVGLAMANALNDYWKSGTAPKPELGVKQIAVTKKNVDEVLDEPKEECGP
jgi:ABC-type sugar transport system substrate-binding protein